MENANKFRITMVISVVLVLFRFAAWSTDHAAGWMLMVGWAVACFVLLVWLLTYAYWLIEQKQEGNSLEHTAWYPFFVGVLGFLVSLLMEIPIVFYDDPQE